MPISKSYLTIVRFRAAALQSMRYRDKFLSDQNWARLINHYNPGGEYDASKINRAFGNAAQYKDVIDLEANDVGIYRRTKFERGSQRRTRYYYFTGTALATPVILCYLSGEQNCLAGVMASSLTALFMTSYMPFIKTQVPRSDIDQSLYWTEDAPHVDTCKGHAGEQIETEEERLHHESP
eukprot:CAMPEP_0119029584 /NCGR_PEP_ID=MMETSP1176-20130426/40595_1 /TAXON_ID=265551 /ORGANISM="Synedropsis recta cf, Strain CCMP1620" /LENGTH=179 /DNA_ID=CAMNT_0006985933 /DNA_START=459 /DNA_END=998 /DNA_ORIENTATION=+